MTRTSEQQGASDRALRTSWANVKAAGKKFGVGSTEYNVAMDLHANLVLDRLNPEEKKVDEK